MHDPLPIRTVGRRGGRRAAGAWVALLCLASGAVGQKDYFTVEELSLGPRWLKPAGTNATSPAVDEAPDAPAEPSPPPIDAMGKEGLEKAFLEIETMLEKYPDSVRLLTAKSVLLIRLRRHEEAIALLEDLHARNPDSVAVMNNLAWVYATADDSALRNGRRAVVLGRRALLNAPMSYHIWSTIAEGHYISGDFEKGLKASREAMRIATEMKADPDNLLEYRNQIRKCAQALVAFSLVE